MQQRSIRKWQKRSRRKAEDIIKEQRVFINYENIDKLCAFLKENGLETGGTGPKVRPIVSCKGTTCQYGLIDTFDLSEKIHYRFYKGFRDLVLPHKFKIAVGGCPNNCVKPDLNDIGVIGYKKPILNFDKTIFSCFITFIPYPYFIHTLEFANGKLQ